jgi:hypothetical protein
VQFGPPPKAPVAAEAEKPAPAAREKTPRVKEKIDPQLIAKARELRDVCLEQMNGRLLIEPRGKYEVSRALPQTPTPSAAIGGMTPSPGSPTN